MGMGMGLCCCGAQPPCADMPNEMKCTITRGSTTETAIITQRPLWGIANNPASSPSQCIGAAGPGFIPVGASNLYQWFSSSIINGSGAFAVGCGFVIGSAQFYSSQCILIWGNGTSTGRSFQRSRIIINDRTTSPFYADFVVETSQDSGATWQVGMSVILEEV